MNNNIEDVLANTVDNLLIGFITRNMWLQRSCKKA